LPFVLEKMKRKAFFILLLLFLTACSPQISAPATSPSLEIPFETLDEEIRISAPKLQNSFRLNDIIELKIEIIGENKILFRPDYQNKIFIYTQENWTEVFHTPPECKRDNILLAPAESSYFSAYPALPDLEEATILRIYFFGNIAQDGEATGKRVGGYTDVLLRP
jgi:hypothetical protein